MLPPVRQVYAQLRRRLSPAQQRPRPHQGDDLLAQGLGNALGLRWLTTTGILLAGGSCVWLAAISQGRE
jgi:hypothetical protein